jgi:hypothetical protein
MRQKGFPPNFSQDLMFQTSAQSDKEIQSYPSANDGYRKQGINCGKVKCTIMFPKGNEPFIW